MAGIRDLSLDSTGDLEMVDADVVLIDEEDLVRQRIEMTLRMFRGEWFLNIEAGVPYYESVLGVRRDLAEVDAVLKAAILGVSGVNRILGYSSELNHATRVLDVRCTVDTIYGPVALDEVLP